MDALCHLVSDHLVQDLPGSLCPEAEVLVSPIFVHTNCFCPLASCRMAASIVRLLEMYVAAAFLNDRIKTTATAPAVAARRRGRLDARSNAKNATKGTNSIGFT